MVLFQGKCVKNANASASVKERPDSKMLMNVALRTVTAIHFPSLSQMSSQRWSEEQLWVSGSVGSAMAGNLFSHRLSVLWAVIPHSSLRDCCLYRPHEDRIKFLAGRRFCGCLPSEDHAIGIWWNPSPFNWPFLTVDGHTMNQVSLQPVVRAS